MRKSDLIIQQYCKNWTDKKYTTISHE